MKKLNRRKFIQTSAMTGLGLGLAGTVGDLFAMPQGNGKRVGIIGLDTSHSVAFTKALNAKQPDPVFKGYRVVASYPQGSKDIASSVERVPGYIQEVKKFGVEIVDSIDSLLKKVDVVLLESNDGRVHLEQAIPVLKARKRMFIDKPIAASYKDAKQIFDLSQEYNTPVFSSSSLRYMDSIQEVVGGAIGKVIGANTYSPAKLEATHPDFYWYGIHGVEMLFALMGTGCKNVTRIHTADTDVVVGEWEDGRLGTFRGTRSGKSDYGGTAFGEKGNKPLGKFGGYNPLLEQIINFFDTGTPPFDYRQTLEICAFIEAADASKEKGGQTVAMREFTI